ncbi:hypothetical protein J6590_049631 [Homalodisca vitripennis]|nr:hypothetical protein J6590_049631 [Homalodisca vitripennis]
MAGLAGCLQGQDRSAVPSKQQPRLTLLYPNQTPQSADVSILQPPPEGIRRLPKEVDLCQCCQL